MVEIFPPTSNFWPELNNAMDSLFSDLTNQLELNQAAPEGLVNQVESELGVTFPQQYIEFITKSNGAEGRVGENSYLILWPLEEIGPLNEAYEVDEFTPGLLLFGSNGGGTAYAFDKSMVPMPIVEIPFISINLGEARSCGKTFLEFLEYLYKR